MNYIDNKHLLMLALNRVQFLTPKEKIVFINRLFNARNGLTNSNNCIDFFKMIKKADLEYLIGRRIRSKKWIPGDFLKFAEQDLKILTHGNINCIFYKEKGYPDSLSEIYDPPVIVFYRGELPEDNKCTVGIVGTRKPTGIARDSAFRLGLEFSQYKVPVVSGLALGIDSSAHAGCVKGKGITLAVLGNGIDNIYPRINKGLAKGILENGGAILSEYSPGVPPLRYNFPARNRIISGLSAGIIIVQAPENSGALITGDYALEQGKELFVHDAGLKGRESIGSIDLEISGAKIITNATDVLKELGWQFSCKKMYDFFDRKEENVDIGLILARLMDMELKGYAIDKNGIAFDIKEIY